MFHATILSLISAAAVLLVYAGLRDIAARSVPNWVALAVLACGLPTQALQGHIFSALAISAAVFIVALIPWRFGVLGGADVKLLAAGVASVPPPSALDYLSFIALAGGVLAALYLALRHVVHRPEAGPRRTLLSRIMKAEAWRIVRKGPLPYATAIAAGALFTFIIQ